MESSNEKRPETAGVPEKWRLVVEGFKFPCSALWGERNWLNGYLKVHPGPIQRQIPLHLLSCMDLLEFNSWLQAVLEGKEQINEFQFMDAFHSFEHQRNGEHLYVSYMFNEFPLEQIHIIFDMDEVRLLQISIESLVLNYPVRN